MQNARGLRSEQQRKAVPAVCSHDYHVNFFRFGDPVNFDLRGSENELLAVLGNAEVLGERGQVGSCLVVDLILHRGEVHWNLAAVGEAEGFDHVDDVQFRAKRIGEPARPTCNMSCIFGKVGGQ